MRAQWLTEMARDLSAPIPFREVFVILALFLPQLTFVDEAATKKSLSGVVTVGHLLPCTLPEL